VRLTAQFLAFSVVGTIGFLIDAGTLQLQLWAWDANPYAARVVSYLVAASVTWLLNRRYTFRVTGRSDLPGEWTRYVVLNAIGGGLNYATYAVALATLPLVARQPVLGVALGSAVGLVVNFTANRYLVFRPGPAR
jgi:putative flippase GtrA